MSVSERRREKTLFLGTLETFSFDFGGEAVVPVAQGVSTPADDGLAHNDEAFLSTSVEVSDYSLTSSASARVPLTTSEVTDLFDASQTMSSKLFSLPANVTSIEAAMAQFRQVLTNQLVQVKKDFKDQRQSQRKASKRDRDE